MNTGDKEGSGSALKLLLREDQSFEHLKDIAETSWQCMVDKVMPGHKGDLGGLALNHCDPLFNHEEYPNGGFAETSYPPSNDTNNTGVEGFVVKGFFMLLLIGLNLFFLLRKHSIAKPKASVVKKVLAPIIWKVIAW